MILACVFAFAPIYGRGMVRSVWADEIDETDKELAPDAELASDTDAKQAEAVVPEGEKKAEDVAGPEGEKKAEEVAGPEGEKKAEDVAGPEGEKKAEEASLNYVVSVEGLDIGDTYFVDYSYDGETWYGAKVEDEKEEHTVITVEEGFNCIWFDLKNIPEGGIPKDGFVSIRVTGKTASPTMAFLSFSLTDYDDEEEVVEPEGVNFKPDGDENGIYMTVDVPLSHILTDPEPLFRRLNVMAAYIDSGNPEIVEEANNYLYAYSIDDSGEPVEVEADNTKDADPEEQDVFDPIKARLAEELYNRFITVAMFESFSIGNIDDLMDRINPIGEPYEIDAEDATGSIIKIPVQDYEVHWGNSCEDGEPFSQIIPVYILPNLNDILVCVDFDESKGSGETFFIRSDLDVIPFTDDPENESSAAVIYYDFDDYRTIVAGGNGRGMFDLNTEGMFSFDCSGFYVGQPNIYPDTTMVPLDLCTYSIRVMKPAGTYVALKGEGETNNYGLVGNNGFATDSIWATGDGLTAYVYIGDTTLYLEPLCDNIDGVTTRAIESVELLDETYVDGVSIDDSDPEKIKLTFSANFYDTIPLLITYTDGTQSELVIRRIGLVIQYMYLGGNPNYDEGITVGELRYDYRNDIVVNFDYNYFAGEQIIIFATYYHPTNDNTVSGGDDVSLFLTYDEGGTEIIEKTAYNAAGNGGVACTTFIIGFAPAKEFDGNLWVGNITEQTYEKGGFSATVVNGGYDSKTSYSGTQTGSGKGVHWDGSIRWFD
jgi:hypothetical protein